MADLLDLIAGQPLALVAFGVVLAVIFGVRYLGIWQGEQSPGAKTERGQILGAVIDGRKADQIIAALDHTVAALNRLNANFEQQAMEEEIERRVQERIKQK